MPRFNITRRKALLILASAVIVVVGVLQFAKLAEDRTLLRPYDFVEYWTTGRLLLDGANPYDPDRLVPMQKAMHDGVAKAVMMWNPPWTLALVVPFASLPWRLAQFLWLAVQMGALLVSADLLWRMYGGPLRYRWVAFAIALTFAPSLFLLLMGQISGLPLLGLVCFLWFLRNDRLILAGCLASMTAIKPHHLALFALILFLEGLRHTSIRKAIAAGAVVLLIGSILPLLWNSHVWNDYHAATRRGPSETFDSMEEFEHSTIGYQLRLLLPGKPFAAQFIPLLLAAIATIVWWRRDVRRVSDPPNSLSDHSASGRSSDNWRWERNMPLLVLISMLATPYGAWAFDKVLLLIVLIPMAVRVIHSRNKPLIAFAAGLFVLLNLLTLETIRNAGSQANPWIAPAVLVGYIATSSIATRNRSETGSE